MINEYCRSCLTGRWREGSSSPPDHRCCNSLRLSYDPHLADLLAHRTVESIAMVTSSIDWDSVQSIY